MRMEFNGIYLLIYWYHDEISTVRRSLVPLFFASLVPLFFVSLVPLFFGIGIFPVNYRVK